MTSWLACCVLLAISISGAQAAVVWTSPGKLPVTAGKLWSLAIDPANPLIALAGTDSGVYRSADGGIKWAATSLHGERVFVVGFDPRGSHPALAGTDGHGVSMSADGGGTWADSSSGLTSLIVRCMTFGVSAIAVGTDKGVDASPDGKTWSAIGPVAVSVSAITVAANSPSFTLLAGTDSGDVSNGALYEYTPTGWVVLGPSSGLPKGVTVFGLASGPPTTANPKRSLVVNASITPAQVGGTYRSVDGGVNWTASQGIPKIADTQLLAPTTTTISPLDPNLVYIGADYGGSSGGDLLRSTDGGATFAVFDSGLPDGSKNVTTIAVAPTTPPIVMAGLNPPTGSGALVYKTTDAQAPPPPRLVAEAGAPAPSAVPTPAPTATPAVVPSATPAPVSTPSGLRAFAQSALHWPTPLIYELLFVLLVIYVFVRWRQRAYIEGPPD